jgi:tripartite ATP-independent transporter DctM subunit
MGYTLEWWAVLAVIFGLLLLLMASGIPVAFAFTGLNILALIWITGGTKGLNLLTASIYQSVASFSLVAVPMFFLLGEVLFQSQVIGKTIDAVDKWIGHVRGRLFFVGLGAGTVVGTLSGAGMADTALIGTTIYPEMAKRGYDRQLSLGVPLSVAMLDVLIPPSSLAVLVGSFAQVSIAKLLIAGILPGLMLTTLYTLYVLLRIRINPALAPPYFSPTVRLTEKLIETAKLAPFGLIIFMVMGFILLGVTTPSEAAATGAVGAILVTAIYRRLNLTVLQKSLLGAFQISGIVFLIITGSNAYAQVLALSGATQHFLEFITGLDVSPIVILILMQVSVLLLGCFLDQVSMMLIAIPIFLPIVNSLGFDPVWFWLLFLMNITIGAITPPFGLVLFVLKGVVPGSTMGEIYRAALPFVILDLVGMLLIGLFPQIALWLPNMMRGE